MDNKICFKTIITFAGAIVAFLIGSGFATGQEVLQYFAAYGYWGVAGAVLTLILLTYVCSSFLTVGFREDFEKGNDIYAYYCGNTLGRCFDYFSTVFCFLSFIVMIAGSAATLNQHYQLPPYIGGILIAVLTSITVLKGLSKIVDVVGKVGPTIVMISILLGIISVAKNYEFLGVDIVHSSLEKLHSEKALVTASSNWYLAAFSYVGFCMLWLAGFLASMGKSAKSTQNARYGGFLGGFLFSLAVIIVALGLMATITTTAGTQIPMLHLASDIHSSFSSVFALIIIAGIYSTAVPLLWNVSSRITVGKEDKFRSVTLVLTIVGLIVGIWLPFDKLVNLVYVINGYFGGILLLIMVYRSLKEIIAPPKGKAKTVKAAKNS